MPKRKKQPGSPLLQSYFYPILFIAAALHVLFIICNYRLNWTQGEVPYRAVPTALQDGLGLSWKDLLRAFHYQGFDPLPRARFLSYLVQDLNIKFRLWLFQYFPPHPSLSLTWFFSLILSPLLLYQLLRNFTNDRTAAWIGISLYLLSTGFLSGITMLFHPGKPLCNFFAILCLYLAAKIIRYARRKNYLSLKASAAGAFLRLYLLQEASPEVPPSFSLRKRCLKHLQRVQQYLKQRDRYSDKIFLYSGGLLGLMFLAYFTDELAWFIPIAVPLLFPAIFRLQDHRITWSAAYLSTIIIFLIFITFIVPPITRHLGYGDFDFWRSAIHPTYDQSSTIWAQLTLTNVIHNGLGLLNSHLEPWLVLLEDKPLLPWLQILYLAYLVCLFWALPGPARRLCLRGAAVVAGFIFFFTCILTKHVQRVENAFYYGNMFSLLIVFPLSLLLACRREPFATINRVLTPGLLILSALRFNTLNSGSMIGHNTSPRFGYRTLFPGIEKEMKGEELTYAMAKKAWEQRQNLPELARMRSLFPPNAFLLFQELEYIGSIGRRLDKAASAPGKNLLNGKNVILTAASQSLPGGKVTNLIDDDSTTFWHVALDKIGQPTWVKIDLGAGEEKIVTSLSGRPRRERTAQFFHTAELSGSSDGQNWNPIAPIIQYTPSSTDDWIQWTFANDRAFRYYRLDITDGHEDGPLHHFYSIAELSLSD